VAFLADGGHLFDTLAERDVELLLPRDETAWSVMVERISAWAVSDFPICSSLSRAISEASDNCRAWAS
jgi:hypothetical protein